MNDPHPSSAPLAFLSVEEIAQRLEAGDVTSLQLVDMFLAR